MPSRFALPALFLCVSACTFFEDFDALRTTTVGAPVATIGFPPAGVTGASSVTVRGTVTDLEGDGIGEVRIGDAVADVDADGRWSVTVPLAHGENTLVVRTSDGGGATDEAAASVTVVRQPILPVIVDMDIDTANDRLIVADGNLLAAIDLETMEVSAISDQASGTGRPLFADQVVLDADGETAIVSWGSGMTAVDLASGERVVYASDTMGSGIAYMAAEDMAVDAAGDAILVASHDFIWAVDRATRERTLVSTSSLGMGDPFDWVVDVVMDEMGGVAIVVDTDNMLTSVHRVVLGTGDRTPLSDETHGMGPRIEGSEAHSVLDPENDRLLVAGAVEAEAEDPVYGVLAVDLGTGDREVFSGPGAGSGPALVRPQSLVLDPARGRLLALDSFGSRLVAIDLATGDRQVALDLRALGAGSGEREAIAMIGLAVDPAADRAVVTRLLSDAEQTVVTASWIASIDLATGARAVLSGPGTGEGEMIGVPYKLAVDAANQRALVLDFDPLRVLAIDLATSDRELFSGTGVEFGAPLDGPDDIAIDPERDRALVLDEGRLLSLGLATGTRAELSGPGAGIGVPFERTLCVAVDAARDRALVGDFCPSGDPACQGDRILAVDLASGARSVLSDSMHGAGPGMDQVRAIAVDGARDRALVYDDALQAVVAVDLDDGDRTILGRPGLESGVPLALVTSVGVVPDRDWLVLASQRIVGTIVMDLVSGETIAHSF